LLKVLFIDSFGTSRTVLVIYQRSVQFFCICCVFCVS